MAEPDEAVVGKEALERVFLATIQLLPAKQRAVLILRAVLHWRAAEVADLLGISEVAVNSALQRARATLQARCPHGRLDWAPAVSPRANETVLLHRYVDAVERADVDAVVELCAGTRYCARRALEVRTG